MSKRFCDHQFLVIKQIEYGNVGMEPMAKVACPFCGQIRNILSTGEIRIIVEEGIVKKQEKQPEQSNANTSTSTQRPS